MLELVSAEEILGPGRWALDPGHQSAPFCRYYVEYCATEQVFRSSVESSRRYGTLGGGVEIGFVGGWFYRQNLPMDQAEFPARLQAAEKTFAEGLWEKAADEWFADGEPKARARNLELQSRDMRAMDDAALLQHIADLRRHLIEGFEIHFLHLVPHAGAVGDWLAHTQEWTGLSIAEVVPALNGTSPDSIGSIGHLERIAAALRASPAAMTALSSDDDAATKLTSIRALSVDVDAALDDYLQEHGARTLTGWDLLDLTMGEMPAMVIAAITAQLQAEPATAVTNEAVEPIRLRVPQEHLAEFDRLFAIAKKLYRLRDSDTGLTSTWRVGLLRLALLEAGRRLAERGQIETAEHVLECESAEVEGLLMHNAGPSAAELERRVEERRRFAENPPPAAVGPAPGPPPSLEGLPPALLRVNRAFFTGMGEVIGARRNAAASVEAAGGTEVIRGIAASRGSYEGRARLVAGPQDFECLESGDILVAPFTTPAYNVVLPIIGGIVTDAGGLLSHAAIVAREYGIPAVVATGIATSTIRDGARLRIDGEAGTVEILNA